MGYPFFNPPNIQKVNTIEQGNYFVPTDGVTPEQVEDDAYRPSGKLKRILTAAFIGLAIAALFIVPLFLSK